MKRKVYVNRDNVIDTYVVIIDDVEFRNIQNELDLWYGKGNLKESVADDLKSMNGMKLDIVSKENVGDEKFLFKYYEFIAHPLSRLCDWIMKSNDPLEFSKYLRHLIEWPESSNVIDYVKRLLGCFSFEKLSIDDVVLSNLTEIKKKKLIERIFEAIEDSDTSPWIIASSKKF